MTLIMKPGFVYILANKNNTTLYVGVTSNLLQRIMQHKEKHDKKSFSARYNTNKLVYYEAFQDIGEAIGREKQIKAGSRAKKIALIEKENAEWGDLTKQVTDCFGESASQWQTQLSLRAKRSEAKQSIATQRNGKRSEAKQSVETQRNGKRSEAKQSVEKEHAKGIRNLWQYWTLII